MPRVKKYTKQRLQNLSIEWKPKRLHKIKQQESVTEPPEDVLTKAAKVRANTEKTFAEITTPTWAERDTNIDLEAATLSNDRRTATCGFVLFVTIGQFLVAHSGLESQTDNSTDFRRRLRVVLT